MVLEGGVMAKYYKPKHYTERIGALFTPKERAVLEAIAAEKKWDLSTVLRDSLESAFPEFAKVSAAEKKRVESVKEK
jgi:hypothetical protein